MLFITGNQKKLEEVKAIIGNDFPLESHKLDRPPIETFLFNITITSDSPGNPSGRTARRCA
jgi:hypothetical protein